MMKIEIEPAVLAKLEEIAEQNQHLSSDEREKLSEKIGRDTPELGVKMRELFAQLAKEGKAETLTALLAQEAVRVASASGWGKRRSLAPDPTEERLALLEKPKPKETKEPLFISSAIQLEVSEAQNLQPKEETKQDEAISLSKLLLGLGAEKREELFKAIGADKALTTTQPLAFQHSKSPAGIPASLENALVAIDKLNIDCKYDIFHDRVVVSEHQIGLRGDVLNNIENVALKVRQAVLLKFRFDPGINFAFDALKLMCLDRVFDPVFDYLEGLQWDGVPRLDSWLIDYCGANETDLNRAIGRKMLVAAVRRVRSPGCKFDYIVVLESEKQGIGKSTALKLLAGAENFSDAEIIGLDKREQQESIQGVWIYEIGELEGMAKSDVRHMKLFASKTVDAARPAYGRNRVDRPRRCIFVATTNEDTYLRDATGNRRFWPVRLHGVIPSADGKKMIDLAALERDRDQLWAEAAAVEATGEPLVIPENLWPHAEVQQLARMGLDPWADTLISVLASRIRNGKTIDGKFALASDELGNAQWRVSTDHLLSDILCIPNERQNNAHTKRIGETMRSLGWHRNEDPMRIGKTLKRGYVRPVGS